LFASGVLFGYYVIVPLSVQFLGTYTVSAEVVNRIDLTSYISMVSSVTLATGLLFQLPIAVYFLSKVGVVTPALLKTYRRHAIVGILLLSAIITPPDVASQVLVTLPVLVLYQISIMVSRRVLKRKAAQI
jgi:sec-independent protein translocase protein TatC